MTATVRVMRVCPAPGYIRAFREKFSLRDKSFADQVKILQRENVYLPGGWAGCMEELGFAVFDSLYDDIELAARWAEENHAGDCFKQTNPLFEVLIRQVQYFKPDVIIFWTGAFFKVDRIHRLALRKYLTKSAAVVGVWGDEVPHGETYDSFFGDLDCVFTVNATYQKHFQNAGFRAHSFGSGFDESIAYDKTKTNKIYDVVMCGDTGYNKADHVNRYDMLCKIAAATNIHIFASEPTARHTRKKLIIFALRGLARLPTSVLVGLDRAVTKFGGARGARVTKAIKFARAMQTGVDPTSLFGTWKHPMENYFVDKKSLKAQFPNKVSKGPLESSKYHELLAQAKIVLNIHRDEPADYGNLRCYEATGVGTLLLTDHGEAMKELFEVGFDPEKDPAAARTSNAEIVAFTDADDCVRKIDFLLKNPDILQAIAQRGQRRTLSDYTVRERCRSMAPALLAEYKAAKKRADPIIMATYDTHYYPIGWDLSFFVEAAEITRRKTNGRCTIINILYPIEAERLPGVPDDYLAAVDRRGLEFRIAHICGQIAQMFPGVSVNLIKKRDFPLRPNVENAQVIDFPGADRPHHTEYYRIVNANPDLVRGFTASPQALRYAKAWLSTVMPKDKRVICITLRAYKFDPQRNSNLAEWAKFAAFLDKSLYEVVIVPDSDQIGEFQASPLGQYPAFWPACFDVDLRFGLYETAYLNLGVNNGPMTTSSLNRNVRHLMFKLLAPGVPHCTEEFIEWSGYKANGSPGYGTKFQKWVWEDDDFPIIRREFDSMVTLIEQSGAPSKPPAREAAEVEAMTGASNRGVVATD